MKPSVDIIVLNYNGRRYLGECLSALSRITYDNYVVCVVDNGSTDDSVEYVRVNFPQFKLKVLMRNVGFARANNLAIRDCHSDFICLLSNDVVVTEDWLDKLMPAFEDSKVGLAVPKMYDFDGFINSGGGICDLYGFAFNRGIGERDTGQYDESILLHYGCAGAAVMRRSVLLRVGVFDEKYFMYHEDVDLSWRIRLQGYKLVYCPSAIVYHKHMGTGVTGKKDRTTVISLWEKNRVRTLLKNYELSTLAAVIPTLIILKFLHMGYALYYRDVREVTGFLAGYLWNFRNLRDTLRQRAKIQASRVISDSEVKELLVPWSIELRLGLRKIRHPIVARNSEVPRLGKPKV